MRPLEKPDVKVKDTKLKDAKAKEPDPKDLKAKEPEGLQITWKDGLPDDPFERMQIETGLKAGGLTSTYSAIKRLLDGDDAAAEEEMKRIAEEQQQSQMAEAAMGMGMMPPGDAEEAQDMKVQAEIERKAEKKAEAQAVKDKKK